MAAAIDRATCAYAPMVAAHAQANGLPVDLVHRVIMRESRYNPRAVHRGNYGMMQIKLATARGLGYTGTAEGLLDPETNLTYAVKYLAALITPPTATTIARWPIMPAVTTTPQNGGGCIAPHTIP